MYPSKLTDSPTLSVPINPARPPLVGCDFPVLEIIEIEPFPPGKFVSILYTTTPSYAYGNVLSGELLITSIARAELGDNFKITDLVLLVEVASGAIK